MEIWKDIKDYEGLYLISNMGNVKSIERLVPNNINGGKRIIKERILKNVNDFYGYYQVNLHKDSIKKRAIVHRLVAEAFLENLNNKPQVNHVNGIKTDNRDINLEWCSSSENIKHAYRTGLRKTGNPKIGGINNHKAKLTESDVLNIREKAHLGLKYLSKQFCISKSNINAIINKKIWKHV